MEGGWVGGSGCGGGEHVVVSMVNAAGDARGGEK